MNRIAKRGCGDRREVSCSFAWNAKNGTPVEAKEFAYSIDRITPTEFWYTVVGTKTAFIATRVDAGFALPARCGDSAR
jgi:hypothetical protein